MTALIKQHDEIKGYDFYHDGAVFCHYDNQPVCPGFIKKEERVIVELIVDVNRCIRQKFYLHELIYKLFKGFVPQGHRIKFIDGNPKNVCADNLAAVPDDKEQGKILNYNPKNWMLVVLPVRENAVPAEQFIMNRKNYKLRSMVTKKIVRDNYYTGIAKDQFMYKIPYSDTAFYDVSLQEILQETYGDAIPNNIYINRAVVKKPVACLSDTFKSIGIFKPHKSQQVFNFSKYFVNDYGQIKNSEDQFQKYSLDGGYFSVYLWDIDETTGRKKFQLVKVHRLVALIFIPNPLGLPYVHHIDSDKSNNHVSNLMWVASKDCAATVKNKKVYQYTQDGILAKTHKSIADAAREINRTTKQLNRLIEKKILHDGYFFTFSPIIVEK